MNEVNTKEGRANEYHFRKSEKLSEPVHARIYAKIPRAKRRKTTGAGPQ